MAQQWELIKIESHSGVIILGIEPPGKEGLKLENKVHEIPARGCRSSAAAVEERVKYPARSLKIQSHSRINPSSARLACVTTDVEYRSFSRLLRAWLVVRPKRNVKKRTCTKALSARAKRPVILVGLTYFLRLGKPPPRFSFNDRTDRSRTASLPARLLIHL